MDVKKLDWTLAAGAIIVLALIIGVSYFAFVANPSNQANQPSATPSTTATPTAPQSAVSATPQAGVSATPTPIPTQVVPTPPTAPVDGQNPYINDVPAVQDCTPGTDRRRQCQGTTLYHQVCQPAGGWKTEVVPNSPDC